LYHGSSRNRENPSVFFGQPHDFSRAVSRQAVSPCSNSVVAFSVRPLSFVGKLEIGIVSGTLLFFSDCRGSPFRATLHMHVFTPSSNFCGLFDNGETLPEPAGKVAEVRYGCLLELL